MYLLWADLRTDVETLVDWKVKGLHAARFFGPREHPIHEVCLQCGKTVDFPVSRRCTACGAYQDKKNPLIQKHNGLDLGKTRNQSIALPWEGKIVKSYFDKRLVDGGFGGGWSLVVSHSSDSPVAFTGYCHLDSEPRLTVGKTYTEGAILGYVGSTGDATGPHLHWTCRKDANTLIDPLEVLMIELAVAEIPWHSVG